MLRNRRTEARKRSERSPPVGSSSPPQISIPPPNTVVNRRGSWTPKIGTNILCFGAVLCVVLITLGGLFVANQMRGVRPEHAALFQRYKMVVAKSGVGNAVGTGNAIIVGATGATGKDLVSRLLHSTAFRNVTAISRRVMPLHSFGVEDGTPEADKLNQVVVDFSDLENALVESSMPLHSFTNAFSCLGTTRADAGSAAGFRTVDLDYVMAFARAVKGAGVKHFVLQSSMGADPESQFLYPQTKGAVESQLEGLEFDRLTILRPSILLANREKVRPMEYIAQTVAKHMEPFIPPSVRAISIQCVAEAMILEAVEQNQNVPSKRTQATVEVFENDDISYVCAAGR